MDNEVTIFALVALNVPKGYYGVAIHQIARQAPVLVVVQDDMALQRLHQALAFFAEETQGETKEEIGQESCLILPAWDCLPYDRVSPQNQLIAQRLKVLTQIKHAQPRIILTSVNALLQRTIPQSYLHETKLIVGQNYPRSELENRLVNFGYDRAVTVRENCEYAIRGDIIDIFPSGAVMPMRLEFFGDQLEKIRPFDVMNQLTQTNDLADLSNQELILTVASETPYGYGDIFKQNYHHLFGRLEQDPLLESVLAGVHYPGQEHWLPLYFAEKLPTLLEWLVPETQLVVTDDFQQQCAARLEMIGEHYQVRCEQMPENALAHRKALSEHPPYYPVPKNQLYLDCQALEQQMAKHKIISLSLQSENLPGQKIYHDFKAHIGVDYRQAFKDGTLFEILAMRLRSELKQKRKVIFICLSEGTRVRLLQLFSDHEFPHISKIDRVTDSPMLGAAILETESFISDKLVVISESDLLGERARRRHSRRGRASEMLQEINALNLGDYVIHAEHGIARYEGLVSIESHQVAYECLHLAYANKASLYLPVENIDLLSRYSRGDHLGVKLDSLGASHWQNRKARMKKHLLEIADKLVETAARRQLQIADIMTKPEGLWDTFCARFPYNETEDQNQVIEDILGDLQAGIPMDRLVCGDAGFGKTEIALRIALVVAAHGKQVIMVAPTTLLVRQHYHNFRERFAGLGIEVAELSRMVTPKQGNEIKAKLSKGEIQIIIGTHSVLGSSVKFQNPGLLIIDEEQHFGVKQKEKLKLWANLHILTMTATPIPRSLNLSLSGLKDLSLITTPPVDRLLVRTFVTPYDAMILGEAIKRERLRGGQIFCVCPRIGDIARIENQIRALIPDLKVAVAHGQIPVQELETTMGQFVGGDIEMILSTNIVESGLDIPRANTILIFHPERFGLAQLYQLRGRVGRGKLRGYCYLILSNHSPSLQTQKRMRVMQSLDSIGAGFQIASHDMDLRGTGNLLGEAQSGKITEIGMELYHSMLREAIARVKGESEIFVDEYSPQVKLDVSVMIPEKYIGDLSLRMGLYQRLASLQTTELIDDFSAELTDRFGKFPIQVQYLLQVMKLRIRCRFVNVSLLEVGAKGLTIMFRENQFANPEGLLALMNKNSKQMSLSPEHRLLVRQTMSSPEERLKRAGQLLQHLQSLLPEKELTQSIRE